jgi:transcriptional regulator with XRE-family HTH domain
VVQNVPPIYNHHMGAKKPDKHFYLSRLKYLREKNGYTQEELAEKASVSLTMLQKMERGNRNGSQKTQRKLAEVLKVSVEYLIFGVNIKLDGLDGELINAISLLSEDNKRLALKFIQFLLGEQGETIITNFNEQTFDNLLSLVNFISSLEVNQRKVLLDKIHVSNTVTLTQLINNLYNANEINKAEQTR